jgi:hypothetical protein
LTNFFGEEKFNWQPTKNKMADEKTEHYNLTRKFVCQSVLRRQPAEFFFVQNFCQMKAGQNKKF